MDEDCFTCAECDDVFIRNHSWDNLTVVIDGEYYCHKCALLHVKQYTIKDVIAALEKKNTDIFTRINIPENIDPVWEGEFSEYSDFGGHTSLKSVTSDIVNECKEKGIKLDTMVIPAIIHTYQFSIALGLFTYKN